MLKRTVCGAGGGGAGLLLFHDLGFTLLFAQKSSSAKLAHIATHVLKVAGHL